ncbi:glycosyltransferase family 2 protein [Paenibacillus sp. sgz500958]|uniref:glycosyltransferase family 2 protein n=1 Tax=Paenibacillus sp. sgz500958 TaxID=3242475 RepID=UPI0036D2B4A0
MRKRRGSAYSRKGISAGSPGRKTRKTLKRIQTSGPPNSRKLQSLWRTGISGLRRTLSVIISARNEEDTISQVIRQASRLNPEEIIVVLNGCQDRSFQRARLSREAIIVHCPESAGHDVGRAIGAKLSRGDILLFLDGDMVISAPLLLPFLEVIAKGADVALNDIDSLLPSFALWDDVTRCKLFLNTILGRDDLGTGSLTAVPHALSRRAVEVIGYQELMVPPKAQAIALMHKLLVTKAGTVNVIKKNRQRQANTGQGNAMELLISGDHAEALQEVLAREGNRLLTGGNHAEKRRLMASWRNGL